MMIHVTHPQETCHYQETEPQRKLQKEALTSSQVFPKYFRISSCKAPQNFCRGGKVISESLKQSRENSTLDAHRNHNIGPTLAQCCADWKLKV